MGWRRSDTLLTVSAFLLPLVTAITSILLYEDISWGNISTTEVGYTFWACIGLPIALFKTWLMAGDNLAVHELRRDWRRALTAAWAISNPLAFTFTFIMWIVVGYTAMMLPSTPIWQSPYGGIPPAIITNGAFLLVEAVTLGVTIFGLLCRLRLGR